MIRKIIAVDLDGVLVDYRSANGTWPKHFGPVIEGAHEFLLQLAAVGDVLIHTCRCNPELHPSIASQYIKGSPSAHIQDGIAAQRVRDWLRISGFEKGRHFHDLFTGTGKPDASVFIDDRAVPCDPMRFGAENYDYAVARAVAMIEEQVGAGVGP